jgi:hypothetical protein
MITIQDVISLATERPDGGKQTIIESDDFIISIVGGREGLYGDFVDDFEIAIIDKETREFITKEFYPELPDDVMGWKSGEETERIINDLINPS